MKNELEVVVIEAVPKMFDIVNTPEKFSHRVSYIKEMYCVNQPITLRPEYLAVRDPGDVRIELIFKIDSLSPLLKGDNWFLKENQYLLISI